MKIKLNKHDLNFFKLLFNHRCLTLVQAYTFYFRSRFTSFRIFYTEYVIPMCQVNLLQIQSGNLSGYCIALTQKSLDILIQYQLIPAEVWDASRNCVAHIIKSIDDVIVAERFIDHQVEMNDFLLHFKSIYPKSGPKYEVLDEKYCSYFSIVRPDSLIRIGGLDLFIEQDMGSESLKQLTDKWNKYRRFLTQEFDHKRKIVILFIVKCKDSSEDKRIDLIRRSLMSVFSSFLTDSVEIFIGSKDQIIQTVFRKVLRSNKQTSETLRSHFAKNKFNLYSGRALKVALEGSVYNYYISCTNSKNELLKYTAFKESKYQEFLVDEYSYRPFSVLSKIAFHERNSSDFDIAYSFKHANQRKIGYIVVCEDLKDLVRDISVLDLFGIPGVYLTTYERLSKGVLHEALIWISKEGTAYSCSTPLYVPNVNLGSIFDLLK